MSIKRRLEAVEREAGGTDPLIVFFRTFFDGKDGGIESEVWTASILSGSYCGTFLKRQGDESFDEFQARVHAVSQGEIGPDEQFNPVPDSKVKASSGNSFQVESAIEKGQ